MSLLTSGGLLADRIGTSNDCIERMRVPNNAILVSMDVTSLYTNIPQEEGIETVCNAHQSFYEGEFPIPTQYVKRTLELILQENSCQVTGKITSKHMAQP